MVVQYFEIIRMGLAPNITDVYTRLEIFYEYYDFVFRQRQIGIGGGTK